MSREFALPLYRAFYVGIWERIGFSPQGFILYDGPLAWACCIGIVIVARRDCTQWREAVENIRKTETVLRSKPTIEGAGVHLKRAFGHSEVPLMDPFLLLDHFGSENPEDYLAGFPWHPHRGIETVTYMIEGLVEHGDSMGNEGAIESGDIQQR